MRSIRRAWTKGVFSWLASNLKGGSFNSKDRKYQGFFSKQVKKKKNYFPYGLGETGSSAGHCVAPT